MNGYLLKETDGNNYLMLVPTTESEEKNFKKMKNYGVKSEIYLDH